jgi:hypothetical protein
MPTPATWQQFLNSVRQIALAYTNALPDFICRQYVKRMAKFGNADDWRLVDQIVGEITNHETGEHYRVLTINNKPPSSETELNQAGFLSVGDFGNSLCLVFAPESKAAFRIEGSARINRRRTVRVWLHVPQSSSRNYIGLAETKVATACSGHCWIDLESRQPVRLELESTDIPRSFPVRKSWHSTDYGLMKIAGKGYWLPVRASADLQVVNEPYRTPVDFYRIIYGSSDGTIYPVLHVRNVIEYKDYRKFGAEVAWRLSRQPLEREELP